jgi:N-acetylmuramoyl-L-alanine amidase
MPINSLLQRLATIYRGEKIRYPKLRGVTLAQWLLESGRATSDLARLHYNFGGLKWRNEMAQFATKVRYEAHDGVDDYCKFATIENFIAGYWAFLNRAPYSGWEEHTNSAEEFIRFIGPIYTPTKDYADNVLALVPEAQQLLDRDPQVLPALDSSIKARGTTDLGTIVLDPGHGGTKREPGSSPNNATSVSGVKEKKLTLDFCLILRDELLKQASQQNETISVAMTRTTDVNLPVTKRAGLAFECLAKLFLSIHFNGGDPSIRGCETFYRAPENHNLNLDDDIAFASDVHRALFNAINSLDPGTKDRGVKPDTQTKLKALGVLNDVNLGNDRVTRMCRAALMEVEYITNPNVEALLVSGPDVIANRTKIMAAVATAIRGHMRAMP